MTESWRKGRRVAIIGAGPGGVSAAIAMARAGYDVKLFERAPEPKPLGGAVLLAVPVLAVLRHYGIDVGESFGTKTRVEFRNNKGHVRAALPFNPEVERRMGIPGWHYGVLRSSAFAKMMDALNAIDPALVVPDHSFASYEDRGDEVIVRFDNGNEVAADLLIGADGIQSRVSTQTFGDPQLFHIGLRLWLCWCSDVPGIPRDVGAIQHSRRVQASYFPMLHDGKPGFEWWIVEPAKEGTPVPENPEAHVRERLREFIAPVTLFPDHTDFATQAFRWEIYNRPSLKHYTKGRIALIGDAAHPVSPYAAYGMGMAIEDGYFLTRAMQGRDLTADTVQTAFAQYESERVGYCNHQVEFARTLGARFHDAPAPVAWLRDTIFDNTRVLQKVLSRDYLADAEKMTLMLSELHVAP